MRESERTADEEERCQCVIEDHGWAPEKALRHEHPCEDEPSREPAPEHHIGHKCACADKESAVQPQDGHGGAAGQQGEEPPRDVRDKGGELPHGIEGGDISVITKRIGCIREVQSPAQIHKRPEKEDKREYNIFSRALEFLQFIELLPDEGYRDLRHAAPLPACGVSL